MPCFGPKRLGSAWFWSELSAAVQPFRFFGTEFPYKGIQKERSRLRKVRLLDGSSFERKVDGEALLPITTHDSGMS